MAEGKIKGKTLFGYDGVNLLKNREGMLTYVSSNETDPMATVFSLSEAGFTVTANAELAAWLTA